MLWFLPLIRRATLMVADAPHGEKWWVGAEDSRNKLITAWSQRPETPTTLAQLKSSDRVGALDGKIQEKYSKGYRQVAMWGKGLWVDSSSNPGKVLLLPRHVPFDTKPETRIGIIRMAGKVSAPTEVVLLELYKGVRPGDTSVRLDHYEISKNSVGAYPNWQTVYANEYAAMEAVDSVISRRGKIGYEVEHRDVSRVSTVNPSRIPIIQPPTEGTLVWDF